MKIFSDSRFTSPLLIVTVIVLALVFWQVFDSLSFAMILFCGLIVVCTYYSAIYLYSRNDSMMGGLPQANRGYTLGFLILACGNLITCLAFLSGSKEGVYIGSLLLLAGTGTVVGASSLLFKHIIRRGLRSQQ